MDAVDKLTLELWGLERLLNISELAAYLRVPVSTIYEWRTKGQAPLAHRYGKHLTFAAADVRAWVDAHRRRVVRRPPTRGDTMSRARLAIGTFGEIGFLATGHGRVIARARYRDWDGRTRLVQVTAETRALAERALKVKLSTRSLFQPTTTMLTPDSLFSHLVDYWLEDLDQEGRLSTTTRQLYERNMRTLVMPTIGNLALREIGVARCDQLLKQLNKRSYSRAKHARVVLRLAFGPAVRHEVLSRNPMDHVARLNRQTTTPDALTPTEVTAIRTAIAVWESGRAISGPKPDGQLGGIVEVMLGTSARIGEVLATRRRDVDITSERSRHRPVPSTRNRHRRVLAGESFGAGSNVGVTRACGIVQSGLVGHEGCQ